MLFVLNVDFLHARRYAGMDTCCGCVSVTSQSSVEMAEQIGLFFSMRASFHLSYTVL